jgi:hypothetical protein
MLAGGSMIAVLPLFDSAAANISFAKLDVGSADRIFPNS